MRRIDLIGRAVGIAAVTALLAGCGGGGAQPQLSSARSLQQNGSAKNGVFVVQPNHSRSWMDPDAKTKDLLYVTNPGNNDVLVYSYPQYKLVGALTGLYYNFFADGVCTDKKGDVWIVGNASGTIVEYKHGGTTQIASLSDPGFYPTICSVDPITGNLAVANKQSNDNSNPQPGNVAIYTHAKGTPKLYTDPTLFQVWFCAYDNKGNLYIDGTKGYSVNFGFAELPKGKTKIADIALMGGTIYFPGKIVWDGAHVVVGDQSYKNAYPTTTGIYQTTGAGGKIVGTTALTGSGDVAGFWIDGKTVIAPDLYLRGIDLYKYPGGGKATKVLPGCSGTSCQPYDAAISVASH